ncbi:hypothetical protein SAMN05216487_4588 [Pseudomonas sp. UC 17F4]|nr:hypothetical protein SAMN05216487_4588 [Pseudomonas sp. UC 17F4]
MYADYLPRLEPFLRTGAFCRQTVTQRVDPCASVGVYNAPRFNCDPNAYRALLLTPG